MAITQEAEGEEPTPPSLPSAVRNPTPLSTPLPPKTQEKRALPQTCEEWDDDAVAEDVTIRQKTPRTSVPPPQLSPCFTNQQTSETQPQKWKQAETPTPRPPEAQAQPNKKRRLNRESEIETKGPQNQKEKLVIHSSLAIVHVEASLHLGKIEHGQTTQISEDEVLGIRIQCATSTRHHIRVDGLPRTCPSSCRRSHG